MKMNHSFGKILLIAALFGVSGVMTDLSAKDYFFSSLTGADANAGTSPREAFRTLAPATALELQPGDRILIEKGSAFKGSLVLDGVCGTKKKPVVVSVYGKSAVKPVIDAAGCVAGVFLRNCSCVRIEGLKLTADGNGGVSSDPARARHRRYGLFSLTENGACHDIVLEDLEVDQVFMEEKGYTRGKDEVNTANGEEMYGFGIRFHNISQEPLTDVAVRNCRVTRVSHTGIQFNGLIADSEVAGCHVERVGGPGMQMSGVKNVHVHHNVIDRSGCPEDSRNWGRGSGYWCFASDRVLFEHNRMTRAHGPNDSFGAHIDFNCSNVIYQYNFSAENAGGFIEILGNNFNCCYRYNVSVNDGHRKEDMDSKIHCGYSLLVSNWSKVKKGPYKTYIYNNTIFTDSGRQSFVEFPRTAEGLCIVNNVFCTKDGTKEHVNPRFNGPLKGVVMKNNLFLTALSWPSGCHVQDTAPLTGDPVFANPGGYEIEDYVPGNVELMRKGIVPENLPEDEDGLFLGLQVRKDILGRKVGKRPGLGAVSPR